MSPFRRQPPRVSRASRSLRPRALGSMSGMYMVMPTIEVRVRARVGAAFLPVRFLAAGDGLGSCRIPEEDDLEEIDQFFEDGDVR